MTKKSKDEQAELNKRHLGKMIELLGTADGSTNWRDKIRIHQGWWRAFVLGITEGKYYDNRNKKWKSVCNQVFYFKTNNDFFSFNFSYSYTLPNYHIIIKLDSLEENHLNNIRKRFFLEPHFDEQKKRIWHFKEKTNYSSYYILSSGKYIPKDNKKAGIQQIGDEDYIRSFIDKYGEDKLIIHEK